MFGTSERGLIAAGAVAAVLLAGPGAAYAADTTTHLSATEMAAALRSAVPAAAAAAAPGWRTALDITGLATGTYAVDPTSKVLYAKVMVLGLNVTEIAVGGRGTYDNISDIEQRKALRMIGHPNARYEFTPSKTSFAAYVKETGAAPADVLTTDTKHAGTRTTHDDGSADYAFTDADHTAVKLHLDPDGVLTSADATESGLGVRFDYTYGPQHLRAPAPADAVSSITLDRAVDYLHMDTYVSTVAQSTAKDARAAAHGRTVTASSLRHFARRDAASVNRTLHVTMVKVKDTSRGVQIYATNPWTHRTVSRSLTAKRK